MMDAREKWLKQAMQLATIFLFEGRRNDDATPMLKQAGDNLQAHLRTTPEGFALVPVPEWVPIDGRALPGLMRGGDYWVVRGARVYIGGVIDLRDPDATHYQIALPPAPPKSEPL